MDLLRNYQVAKELGIIDGDREPREYDTELLRKRILDAYKARFNPTSLQADQVSSPSSPSRRKTTSSPPSRTATGIRDTANSSEFALELKAIISGLEDRVSDLEDRNESLREKCDQSSKEFHELKQRYTSVVEERDRLKDQMVRMKNMVASESTAGRILQRVSDTSNGSAQSSERKLEIYRQQIVLLTEELTKLKQQTTSI